MQPLPPHLPHLPTSAQRTNPRTNLLFLLPTTLPRESYRSLLKEGGIIPQILGRYSSSLGLELERGERSSGSGSGNGSAGSAAAGGSGAMATAGNLGIILTGKTPVRRLQPLQHRRTRIEREVKRERAGGGGTTGSGVDVDVDVGETSNPTTTSTSTSGSRPSSSSYKNEDSSTRSETEESRIILRTWIPLPSSSSSSSSSLPSSSSSSSSLSNPLHPAPKQSNIKNPLPGVPRDEPMGYLRGLMRFFPVGSELGLGMGEEEGLGMGEDLGEGLGAGEGEKEGESVKDEKEVEVDHPDDTNTNTNTNINTTNPNPNSDLKSKPIHPKHPTWLEKYHLLPLPPHPHGLQPRARSGGIGTGYWGRGCFGGSEGEADGERVEWNEEEQELKDLELEKEEEEEEAKCLRDGIVGVIEMIRSFPSLSTSPSPALSTSNTSLPETQTVLFIFTPSDPLPPPDPGASPGPYGTGLEGSYDHLLGTEIKSLLEGVSVALIHTHARVSSGPSNPSNLPIPSDPSKTEETNPGVGAELVRWAEEGRTGEKEEEWLSFPEGVVQMGGFERRERAGDLVGVGPLTMGTGGQLGEEVKLVLEGERNVNGKRTISAAASPLEQDLANEAKRFKADAAAAASASQLSRMSTPSSIRPNVSAAAAILGGNTSAATAAVLGLNGNYSPAQIAAFQNQRASQILGKQGQKLDIAQLQQAAMTVQPPGAGQGGNSMVTAQGVLQMQALQNEVLRQQAAKVASANANGVGNGDTPGTVATAGTMGTGQTVGTPPVHRETIIWRGKIMDRPGNETPDLLIPSVAALTMRGSNPDSYSLPLWPPDQSTLTLSTVRQTDMSAIQSLAARLKCPFVEFRSWMDPAQGQAQGQAPGQAQQANSKLLSTLAGKLATGNFMFIYSMGSGVQGGLVVWAHKSNNNATRLLGACVFNTPIPSDFGLGLSKASVAVSAGNVNPGQGQGQQTQAQRVGQVGTMNGQGLGQMGTIQMGQVPQQQQPQQPPLQLQQPQGFQNVAPMQPQSNGSGGSTIPPHMLENIRSMLAAQFPGVDVTDLPPEKLSKLFQLVKNQQRQRQQQQQQQQQVPQGQAGGTMNIQLALQLAQQQQQRQQQQQQQQQQPSANGQGGY